MFQIEKLRCAKRAHGTKLTLENLENRMLLAGDLVAHWKAEDLAGSVADGAAVAEWTDSVGNVTAESTNSPTYDRAAFGGRAAVRFDPSDKTQSFRVSSSDSPLRGANDFSVVVAFASASQNLVGGEAEWFKNSAIVDGSSLGFANDWGVSINQNGRVGAGLGNGFVQVPTTIFSESENYNDNQIHTAVFSREGTEISLRIDGGNAVSDASASSSQLSSLDMIFGAQKPGSNAFEGLIGEIRVYDGALDNAEATQVFHEISSFYDNQAPTAVDDQYELTEDPLLYFVSATDGVLANDTDPESDPLTAVLVDDVKHGKLGLSDDGSFFYNPDRNYFGTDSFTYSADDFRESPPAIVTFVIHPSYDPATSRPDSYKAIPSETLIIPVFLGVLANDENPDDTNLKVVVTRDVGSGSLTMRNDGAFSYNAQGFAGETSFAYRIDDGRNLSNESEVTFVVNTPPAVVNDQLTTAEDIRFTNLDGSILANDIDLDGDRLTIEIVDPPDHGNISAAPDRSLEFIPEQDFFGSDVFTYRLFDGVDRSPISEVTIDITPVNDAPNAASDSYVGLLGEPIERLADKGVLSNDFDVDHAEIAAELIGLPQHGELAFNADGSFRYTPEADFLGTDTFTYRASDSLADSDVTEVALTVTSTPVVITEFMATNATLLETNVRFSPEDDFYKEDLSPDWIELSNLVSAPVDIGGMLLTDDPDLPAKWAFPEGTVIPPSSHMIVYASGLDLKDPALDRNGRLHTNFNLTSDGEYLALALEGGTILTEFPTYPSQKPDVSWGEFEGNTYFFTEPTPGAVNTQGISGAVVDTIFSIDRGFFNEPFMLEISTQTPRATIVYTTDGSTPTLENGMQLVSENADQPTVGNIEIIATTTLRAAAFHDGMLPTNVDTHSYFFVSDIVDQRRISSRVRDHAEWGPQLADSIVSLPVISLVSDDRISQRESGTSMEMIFPNGEEAGFQIDAGVEHYGGHSLNSPKKNIRLSFKSRYGDGSLKYDLFGQSAANEFEQILLRTGSHDTWFWTHPQGGRGNYTRNRWAFDRQLEMGQEAPHGRYVQVFVNGEYFGMHHLMERPNTDFMASYNGGYSFQYDALNAGSPIGDSDGSAWRDLTRARDNTIIGDYDEVQKYVDVENYADYMLLQFYSGNDWDWNHAQNWSGARKNDDESGFVFFAWDSDVILRSTANANVINRGGPGNLWNVADGMKQHAEFIMLMADRAQRYFFNGGMFSDARLRADINAIADQIRLPLIAETARWGGTSYLPNTWESAIDWMLDRYAPEGSESRATTTIEQMRRAGIFPSIDAPSFSVGANEQLGGDINLGDEISITSAENGATIYYTHDESDPRLPGGGVNATALVYSGEPITINETTNFKARILKDGEWSTLQDARFRVNTVPADANNFRLTEIQYHPADLTEAERQAGIGDSDDFEFLEFTNISNLTIDLSLVKLRKVDVEGDIQGVEFDFSFSEQTELGPGERVLVVEDLVAFAVRYGDGLNVAGKWNGALSNAGETLSLIAGESVIHEFAYADDWYPQTDGNGPSLHIVNELADLNTWSDAASWRASSVAGGSPGSIDEFIGKPGDANRDGIFNSTDLVLVFQAGEYEDGIAGNSTWEEGDWNHDGDFTSGDLVLAFAEGEYSAAAFGLSSETVAAGLDPDSATSQRELDFVASPVDEHDGPPVFMGLQLESVAVEKIFESENVPIVDDPLPNEEPWNFAD